MRSIYLKNLLGSYLKKKKMIIIWLIVFILIFGALGVRQSYPDRISASLGEEVQQYQDTLQQYDEAIQNIQENIVLTQSQVDMMQQYCEESILMQMDPSDVQVVNLQYMIRVNDMDSNDAGNKISYILNAWTVYINSGSLKSEIADEVGDIPLKYLSELVSCGSVGNILGLYVKHSDMEKAKEIMAVLKQKVEDYYPEMQQAQGSFEMVEITYSELAQVDTAVQSTQNTNLTTFRNNKNTLVDYQTKLITKQTEKNNYAQQYKPTGVNTDSPKKTLLKYGALGVLAGIIVPLVIYALYYTISGRVKSKEELLAAELNIIASYHPKKGYTPSVNRVAADISLLAKRNSVTRVCINVLGKSELLNQVDQDITQLLTQQNLEVMSVYSGNADPDQIRMMAEANNNVLLIETGRTSYSDLEEQIQFCRRFKIPVWGCIVIE